MAVKEGEIVEKCWRHTVGACADDQPYHIGDGEGFFVFGFEVLERVVGIGVGLKVGEVLHVGIFLGEEAFAFFQLLGDGLGRSTIVGVEGLVVAIGASACAHPTVAVGTGKACVDGYFLGLGAELGGEPGAVVVVESHGEDGGNGFGKTEAHQRR